MRNMEFSGRTVDEAIFHGLNEMGLSIDAVDIVTLQTESKGIFGLGAKNAIVRMTERVAEIKPDFAALAQKAEEEKRAARGSRERSDSREGGGYSRDRASQNRDATRRPANRERAETKTYDYSKEFAEGNNAAQFLTKLLETMEIPATVTGLEADDGIRLNMESETDGLLIGRRGETLDAMQYLVSLYVNKDRNSGYTRVTLDTESYRVRREETLGRLARRAAVQVSKTGKTAEMEPMNPYERRILHAALQSFRGVTTHSEGEEPNRRVIITSDR